MHFKVYDKKKNNLGGGFSYCSYQLEYILLFCHIFVKMCGQPPITTWNIPWVIFCIDSHLGKLIGIIGPVGYGKSSLLQPILRELSLESGSIEIDGQNILFGKEYDRDRYNSVVKCFALLRDYEKF